MTQEQRLIALAQALGADIKTLLARTLVVQLTQAQYDALATKDPNTLYVIIG